MIQWCRVNPDDAYLDDYLGKSLKFFIVILSILFILGANFFIVQIYQTPLYHMHLP